MPVNEDISRCWIVETTNKRGEGRLAGSRKTDDSGVLVGLDVQREVVDDLYVWTGRIGEVDIADLDITCNCWQRKTLVVCAIDVGLTFDGVDNLAV